MCQHGQKLVFAAVCFGHFHFGPLAVSNVPHDLGIATLLSRLIPQGSNNPTGPELRPVLADVPTLVFRTALLRRYAQFVLGLAVHNVFRSKNDSEGLPND